MRTTQAAESPSADEKITAALRLVEVRKATQSGEALDLRCRAGLSRSEVGEVCGVDPATVWRWENGRAPRGPGALRYAELLEALRRGTF